MILIANPFQNFISNHIRLCSISFHVNGSEMRHHHHTTSIVNSTAYSQYLYESFSNRSFYGKFHKHSFFPSLVTSLWIWFTGPHFEQKSANWKNL